MSVTVHVPRDAGALALGAEGVARAIAREAQERGRAGDTVLRTKLTSSPP